MKYRFPLLAAIAAIAGGCTAAPLAVASPPRHGLLQTVADSGSGNGSITGSAGTAKGGEAGSQTEPGKVAAGHPPGATKNAGVTNTVNGRQSGSGNQTGGEGAGAGK